MLAQLTILSVLCLTLIYSTGLIVSALKEIAKRSKLSAFGVTALFLAISTSLPELVVSLVASIEGNTSLILGNIVGSNIADLSLVIGGAALVGGTLKLSGDLLSRDIYLTGVAGFLPLFLIADKTLSRQDGIVLLVVYFVMMSTFLRSHTKSVVKNAFAKSPIRRLLSTITNKNGHAGALRFLVGAAILITSSHFIVKLAQSLAASTGLTPLFIGLFVVAVGTSLPELAFEMKAIRAGQAKMALGDLLGSVVANATLILGLSSLINPIQLTNNGLGPYTVSIIAFTLIYGIFILFVRTKKRLDWWEGLLLLTCYFAFIFVEFLRA